MNNFGRTLVRGAGAALVALSMGSACASEFTDKVERLFSSSVVESVSESGPSGTVVLQVPSRTPGYFESGDKANKVFAIESVRIFREVPALERLNISLPRDGGLQTLNVTRSQVEAYYGISIAATSDPSIWREKFIQVYDNPGSRAKFVEKFVTGE